MVLEFTAQMRWLKWANSQMLLVTIVFRKSLFWIFNWIFQQDKKTVYLMEETFTS